MAARSKARKRAFQILFEADQRGASVQEVLADQVRHARSDDRQPPVSDFTMQLVEGYAAHVARIDELIATYAVDWDLDRMPVVDRNIVRLGAYEVIWEDGTGSARQGVLHRRVADLRQRSAGALQGPEAASAPRRGGLSPRTATERRRGPQHTCCGPLRRFPVPGPSRGP